MQRNCSEEVQKTRCDRYRSYILHCTNLRFYFCRLWDSGHLTVTGSWPTQYAQTKCIEPFNGKLQYVSLCPKEPVPKMAFCREHCELAEKQNIFHTCRYFSYDQRAPRHSCHHKMKTMHQRLSATRIPALERNCRNGKGVIFLLFVVVATLILGSPSTSKYLIMLTCPIRSAQHSAMGRTKWPTT